MTYTTSLSLCIFVLCCASTLLQTTAQPINDWNVVPAALGRQSDGDNGPKVATGVAGTVCGVYKVSTGLLIRIGKPEDLPSGQGLDLVTDDVVYYDIVYALNEFGVLYCSLSQCHAIFVNATSQPYELSDPVLLINATVHSSDEPLMGFTFDAMTKVYALYIPKDGDIRRVFLDKASRDVTLDSVEVVATAGIKYGSAAGGGGCFGYFYATDSDKQLKVAFIKNGAVITVPVAELPTAAQAPLQEKIYHLATAYDSTSDVVGVMFAVGRIDPGGFTGAYRVTQVPMQCDTLVGSTTSDPNYFYPTVSVGGSRPTNGNFQNVFDSFAISTGISENTTFVVSYTTKYRPPLDNSDKRAVRPANEFVYLSTVSSDNVVSTVILPNTTNEKPIETSVGFVRLGPQSGSTVPTCGAVVVVVSTGAGVEVLAATEDLGLFQCEEPMGDPPTDMQPGVMPPMATAPSNGNNSTQAPTDSSTTAPNAGTSAPVMNPTASANAQSDALQNHVLLFLTLVVLACLL